MKKLGYILTTIALAIICVCALVACGSKEGVYKFHSMTTEVDGQKTELKVGDEYKTGLFSIELTENYFVVELKEDGTFTVSTINPLDKSKTIDIAAGTWKESEENSKEIVLDKFATVQCNGSKITFKYEGNELVLKK